MSRKLYTKSGFAQGPLNFVLREGGTQDLEFYNDNATINDGAYHNFDFADADWGYNKDFILRGIYCQARFTTQPFQFFYQYLLVGIGIYAPGYIEPIGTLGVYYMKDPCYNGTHWYSYLTKMLPTGLQVDQANKIRVTVQNYSGVNTDVGECYLYICGVPV